jgi:hypothetical protein
VRALAECQLAGQQEVSGIALERSDVDTHAADYGGGPAL